MLKAKPSGCAVWEVRGQGLNMGWGLRMSPQAKGKLLRLETKEEFLYSFLDSVKKNELKGQNKGTKEREKNGWNRTYKPASV